jgi:chromosome segregation ATPase
MMTNLTPPLPPVTLTDEAMKLAATLLQICADPIASKSRLDELSAQIAAVRSAIDEHAAAKTQAETAAAALADVEQRSRDVASREDSLLKATTQLSVANHANASREDSLNLREQSLDRRQAEIEARAKALDDRLASYRQALA